VHLSRLAMAPGQKLSGGELANCNVTPVGVNSKAVLLAKRGTALGSIIRALATLDEMVFM
jgi:hypothetical protein